MLVTRRLAVITTMIGLVLSACGGSSAVSTLEVRPFREVQASDLTFSPDLSDPSSGVFRVTTTEPMICAIVWGEDASFGRFNNSLSMNGTGIVQHDVRLPDVKAGTTYHFVVQGTTASGTLYRSEPGSFTIDTVSGAAPTVAGLGPNLALEARVVAASSSFSSDFAASNAIDGKTSTAWSSRGDGDAAFLTIALPERREIAAVEFVTRSMADGSAITDTFTVSIDGGQPLGPFRAGTLAQPSVARVTGSGRELRFDVVSSTGGNVGAVEVRVYGPAS